MEPRKEQITEDARSRPMVVADPWKAVTAYWSNRITTKIQVFVLKPSLVGQQQDATGHLDRSECDEVLDYDH